MITSTIAISARNLSFTGHGGQAGDMAMCELLLDSGADIDARCSVSVAEVSVGGKRVRCPSKMDLG